MSKRTNKIKKPNDLEKYLCPQKKDGFDKTRRMMYKILHKCSEVYATGAITRIELEDSLDELEIPYEGGEFARIAG